MYRRTEALAQGITEFTDQLPLIAGFASAYAEVNAEQTQKVPKHIIMTFDDNDDEKAQPS